MPDPPPETAVLAHGGLIDEPASVGSRMGATLVDLLLVGIVSGIGALFALPLVRGCKVPGCEVVVLVGPAIGLVLLLGLQSFLFATRGQTLGKRLMGIRVVRIDGSKAGFARGVLLRWLPILFVPGVFFGIANSIWKTASENAATSGLVAQFGYNELDSMTTTIPIAATVLFLVADVVPAFFSSGRALHDRIAGTRVAANVRRG